ncbi:MAG: DNA polymerase I [Chloroflexota bacterium]
MNKPLLVLFDGNAIVHRAYHAFQTGNRPIVLTVPKTGEVVTAVFGFAQMLLKVINDLKPTCYAVAFDTKAPTFRHKMSDTYKAQRPPTPPELIDQFGRVKQLVEAFHIPIYELDGYEADDVLGALSHQASQQGVDTIIVTGDADTMQLVSPAVTILYPKKSFSDTMIYDEAAVKERYGIEPGQIADYKALVGDPSDNIPGVRGIGEKTAVKLLQQFGSIEGIYSHLDKVTPPRIQTIMREQEAVARQSKVLTTIDIKAPVTLDLEACHVSNYDRAKISELFRELEFSSLLSKLPEMAGAEPEAAVKVEKVPLPECTYCTVNTPELLDKLINRLSSVKSFAFDTETTGLDPMTARLVGISLSPASGESYYIPVGHLGFMGIAQQLSLEYVLERLKPVLADPALAKFAHNANYDMTVLAEQGVTVNNLTIDTMVAAHLLSESSLGLKALAFSRLGIEMTPITDLIGTGAKQLNMSQVEIDKAAVYACADADMTGRLAELLAPELLESDLLWKLFADVEMPLVPVLVDMERNGIALDTGLLRQMAQELGEQLRKLESEIYNNVGHQFNINSPQQLGLILFEELKLSTNQKKKGSYSTAANVLEELRGTHPIIQLILDYRQAAKLKSTYIDALPSLLNSKTGRLHTSFNQTRTATGRLSSSDPNLQNIPVRGELGKQVRQAFIAPSGSYLLSGDYSQIDLRALAHLSKDPALVEAFEHDEDIHSATARRLYGVELSQVTPDMRRFAKTVNFGVIYGMSGYGLEQATELSREQATQFIKAYFEKYPGVTKYLEATRQQARQTGYVQTLLGRRRSIPEINSPNRQVREAAERMAINMPVQGTSADIIKVAMVKLFKDMTERRLKSKMLLQVHDELLFEVPEDELEEMRRLVPDIMSNAIKLSIPVKVDIKVGPNWADMK